MDNVEEEAGQAHSLVRKEDVLLKDHGTRNVSPKLRV